MKIAFLDPSPLRYTPETPFVRALGGTQSAACFLSAALARLGHEVSFINLGGSGERVLGVSCLPLDLENPAAGLNDYDVVVVLTAPLAAQLREAGVTAHLVNWQQKTADNDTIDLFNKPAERRAWSATVFVSEFQKASFVEKWQMDGPVLRNAISPVLESKLRIKPSFAERGEPPVLVYASAPGRGLDFLLMAFPTIRKLVPGAILRVFSDQAMYQVEPEKDEYSVYYEVARNLPGVEYVGGVSQAELADALLEADIWAYPTIFVETSCIVMMEAGAAGCLLLTSSKGALRETGGGFGRIMNVSSSRAGWSLTYARHLASEVGRLRKDPNGHRQIMERQMHWFRETCNWDNRAREWDAWLCADLMEVG